MRRIDDGSRLVEDAIAAVDGDACIELARELVRIPSVTGDERAVQERVAVAMRDAGLEVDVFEAHLESLGAHPRFPGMEVRREEAVLVVGRLGTGTRSLLLNGHVDVVPEGTRPWTYPPFAAEIQGGRIFGRGACDMKSGLAAAIAAAAALKRLGLPSDGQLLIESVVGEEDGGVGTFACLERGVKADAAIVVEPTKLELIPAQAGALSFRLTVEGKAAHAAVRYEGVSAIEKFVVVQDVLKRVEQELNESPHELFESYEIAYPLSIGILSAGSWSAMVPDRLECEGRVGVPVGRASGDVRRLVEDRLRQASQQDEWLRDHPPRLEWVGGQFDAAESDPSLPPFRLLAEVHAKVLGSEPHLGGAPYGSDMRLLVNEAGIPTVLYGPGDIRLAHQVDESIAVDEVIGAARVLAGTAAAYLGDPAE